LVWVEGLESATKSITNVEGVSFIVLKESARDCGSHSPDHDVQDDNCCGIAEGTGRGAEEA
jgi:hypothetical protein